MKGRRIFLAFVAALLFPALAHSSPFLIGTFPDNYLHPLDVNPGEKNVDVIGSSNFNLIGYRIWGDPSNPGWVQIDILTAGVMAEGTRVTDAAIGDLLLDTGLTGNFDLGVALRTHRQSPFFTSMGIEDSVLQKGDIYSPSSYRTSDDYYDPSSWYYGDHEIVTGFGGVLGKADVLYDGAGIITVAFRKDGLDPENLRVHLAWNCANDVMDTTTRVPEPATLLLLGCGIIGLAAGGKKVF